MTTIEFTERIALFFSRYLEFHKPSLLERVEKLKAKTPDELREMTVYNDTELLTHEIRFKGFLLVIHVDFEECDEECDDDEGEPYIIPSSLKLYGELSFGSDVSLGKRHFLGEDTADKDWVYSFVKKYSVCKGCESFLGEKDDLCVSCYPYVCKQEDECCVCKENEGVWVKLSCKHILHKACWYKTLGLKCPLCREEQRSKLWADKI